MIEGLIGFAAMGILMMLRLPIAISMAVVGFVGVGLLRSWPAAISTTATEIIGISSYSLSVIPLFVLMGNFITRAGMSRDLYQAAYSLIGHRRGGLSMSTVVACAGFGAICGSSIATVATMARVAMPEMKRFNYDPAFAAGSICAGSTLGILIPPSVILVIYGIMTEQSIGALFAAGLIPGIIATLFYLGACVFVTRRQPGAGPAGERIDWPGRMRALRHIWGVLLLFGIVMGGMYGGLFTPTEAAGVGAMGGFLFALARRTLSVAVIRDILMESARTTAMLFTILIGAMMFSNFLNFTSLPSDLRDLVTYFDVAPLIVVVAICLVYVILGMAMESLSMMLLTVPIFYPLIVQLGLDPIWFGVIVVCVIEISLITPPIGLNIFVLSNEVPDVPTPMIWRGVLPFIAADILRMGVLIAFPAITLFLPVLLDL
ncbi:TRAP transporter large permease [Oceanibacterium hippocampi]|uniref:TRAP transporter large permease protein n=1 Tax=Oceanibacterium hippocampi TaxID=745714 RepID=A0A1Y5TS91_9PROT|nr:TRAP transporter large permease [Oceanibacterium hippocampi]SLN71013.1 Sialic acid TRAP transporter permease protein SiaT [Oceanibacterium hippocampi]